MDADDLERVVRTLAPDGELVETRSLAGGVSTGARVVEVRSAAGALRRFVVREHRRGAAEWRLLRLLSERGFPVPEPVLLAEPIVVTDGDLPTWDVRAVDRPLPGVHLFDPAEERQAEMRSLAKAFRARASERLSSR